MNSKMNVRGARKGAARKALTVLLWAAWLTVSVSAPAAQEDVVRAGVAKIDITPTQSVTLAGYASRTNLSQGVHDPLSARVIAFARDDRRLVLVSVDNLGFYNGTAGPLRQAILEAGRLKPSELFLCAIHTHSAPSLTLDVEKGHPNNV
jgi:neutral ceramidase